MAMWKKMAAAFGRAVKDPGATQKGRDLVFESKTVKNRTGVPETEERRAFNSGEREAGTALTKASEDNEIPDEAKRIWDNYDLDYERAYGPSGAYERAVDRAKIYEDENLPTSPEAFEERYGFAVDGQIPDHKTDIQRQFDNDMTRRTNKSLEKEFDEGFRSAIARRKQDVKDWYGKDFPKDMVDEGADTFEEDLWRVIGELRDKGMSGADILNVLKGSNR